MAASHRCNESCSSEVSISEAGRIVEIPFWFWGFAVAQGRLLALLSSLLIRRSCPWSTGTYRVNLVNTGTREKQKRSVLSFCQNMPALDRVGERCYQPMSCAEPNMMPSSATGSDYFLTESEMTPQSVPVQDGILRPLVYGVSILGHKVWFPTTSRPVW